MNYQDMTFAELEEIDLEEAWNIINAAILKLDAEYPTFTDSDKADAADNAVNSPCDGMSYLDLYSACLGSVQMEKEA